MEKLFMIEVLIDKVIFSSKPIPQKKQLVINATCGNLMQLEIRTDVMGALETQEVDSKRMDIDVNCGKSYVFSIKPSDLKETIKKFPMEIFVSTKLSADPIGSATVHWGQEFSDMVDSTEDTFGYATPVYTRALYPLQKGGRNVGNIETYIRLSPLGKNIDTHIQIMETKATDGAPGTVKQYLFKDSNNATTFQCQKYGMGSETDVIPVAKVYGAADRYQQQSVESTGTKDSGAKGASITGGADFLNIFQPYSGGSVMSIRSIAPSAFQMSVLMMGLNEMMGGGMSSMSLQSTMSSNIHSLRSRPPDRLFLDIRDLFNDRAFSSFFGQLDMNDQEIDYKTLTKEQIERMLCKHPDCPAAKKFKDFGIGPLARGNGLGGLYKDVEAPCTYGLSHCNGRFDRYGPLGTYSRPKRPEEPFIPKDRKSSGEKSGSSSECCNEEDKSDCLRLSGGSSNYYFEPKTKLYAPLRLRGGSPIPQSADIYPNPQNECKDLMEEYNKLLTEYKKALGPCGQATCPFANTMVEETCKTICHPVPEECKDVCDEVAIETPVEAKANLAAQQGRPQDVSGCAAATCPYGREVISPADKDHKKKQTKPACGSPTCPFIREKLGLEDADDVFMPPQKCADKKCPINTKQEQLPPIHWDCPDPLPKGECKNPECPFANKEKIIEKYFPPAKSPCGAPTCPFQTAPCNYPGCPFAEFEPCPPSCPYLDPVPTLLECSPSICPFVDADKDPCSNQKCPFAKKKPEECPADCPLNKRKPPCEPKPPCLQKQPSLKPDPCYEGGPPCFPPCIKPYKPEKKSSSRKSESKISGEGSIKSRTMSSNGNKRNSKKRRKSSGDVKSKLSDECHFCFSAPQNSTRRKSANSKKKVFDDSYEASQSSDSEDSEICGIKTCGAFGGDLICNECIAPIKPEDDAKGGGDRKSRKKSSAAVERATIGTTQKPASQVLTTVQAKIPSEKQIAEVATTSARKSLSKKKHKKKKKKHTGYVYDEGTYYPGTKIGHRECIVPKFNVPPDMGWLWNVHTTCMRLRPRRGWKPGAIGRTIAARIDEHRKKYGLDPVSVPPQERKRRKGPGGGYLSDSDDLDIPLKPTLQVKKKDGIVYVTMNPLKDPKTLEEHENPYMDCSPMQFKIMKNKPPAPKKTKEFKMCYCGEGGEEIIEEELSSTSSSELDIEFTPPAGIIRPEQLKKKKNICHMNTQYDIEDCPVPLKAEPKKKGASTNNPAPLPSLAGKKKK